MDRIEEDLGLTGERTQGRTFKTIGGSKSVISVNKDADIFEAISLMRDHHIGDVIVIEGDQQKVPVGIVTDRDIALRVVDNPTKLGNLKISDVMSTMPATARDSDDVFEMIRIMKECGVSRLPIVDHQGVLIGVVTAKKLFQCLTEGLNDLASLSEQQQMNEIRSHH